MDFFRTYLSGTKSHLWLLLFTFWFINLKAQDYKIHSHNDYLQNVPFWKAYSVGVASLEADIFLSEERLLVAHTLGELDANRTFQTLYLEPLETALKSGFRTDTLQLLIDIKSEPYTTLDALIEAINQFPTIAQSKQLSIVISGNRPNSAEYVNYPDFILFDYQSLEPVNNASVLEKIGLISLSFRNFTTWNGKGRLTKEDSTKVKIVIEKAHSFKKPFRFWATPDSKTAWRAMVDMGVDFINTDHPFECWQYLSTLSKRTYQNDVFSEVYQPSFKSDDANEIPKNIILMIGDGNGLSQISATSLANGGALTLTQLKNIGLIKTQSSDDFCTDSAAGATAFATGKKVPNRAIGVDNLGASLPNLVEILSDNGFMTGIITTDEITGATPASFYAHQKDRGMTDQILKDLANSPLSFFVSAPASGITNQETFGKFRLIKGIENATINNLEGTGYFFREENAALPLSNAVENVLAGLSEKKEPFFLMVEGAKIDSYGHFNEIDGIVKEGIAFDRALSKVLQFADANANTLVLVTADHETGGLAIPSGDIHNKVIEGDFTTDDHTGTFVPIFAYGPQSSLFRGVYENNELFYMVLEVLQMSDEAIK